MRFAYKAVSAILAISLALSLMFACILLSLKLLSLLLALLGPGWFTIAVTILLMCALFDAGKVNDPKIFRLPNDRGGKIRDGLLLTTRCFITAIVLLSVKMMLTTVSGMQMERSWVLIAGVIVVVFGVAMIRDRSRGKRRRY